MKKKKSGLGCKTKGDQGEQHLVGVDCCIMRTWRGGGNERRAPTPTKRTGV